MVSLYGLMVCIAIAVAAAHAQGTGADDLITADIPGLNYKPTFKQYSGYLNATDGHNLFYWLVESQDKPSSDPIVLWLNGGPGCSSLGGFLTELGPFHQNPDGHTLFENVFAWNKFANVIFLESPTGVGFSYSDPKDDATDDDKTAYYNFHALRDFFYTKFPEYQTRDFYVTGESYGGIYIPTLSKNIVDGIKNNTFPDNFRGIAIGNGYMNVRYDSNSLVNYYYFHGMTGADEWNSLLAACCGNTSPDQCDFYNLQFKNKTCGDAMRSYGSGWIANDAYNIYQDCYHGSDGQPARRVFNPLHDVNHRYKLRPIKPARKNSFNPGTSDMSHDLNYDSTDADFGFQCWANEVTYFNDIDVKKALHVREEDWDKHWCSCCNIRYKQLYDDMADFFKYIIQNSNIRILIYNGDVDTRCNFLSDQWFIEREVAPQNDLKVLKNYGSWIYRKQVAGFVKQFERLDLLTVKGSGHFVPEDRAGPALQMIANFIRNTGDYSKATGIDVTPKPLNA